SSAMSGSPLRTNRGPFSLLVTGPSANLTHPPTFLRDSAAQGGEQRVDLLVDGGLARVVERRGNLLTQDRPVALPEPLDGRLDGPLGHSELHGDRRVGLRAGASAQHTLESLEQRCAARAGILASEPREHAVEQGQGPAPVEEAFGSQRIGRLAE